MPNNLGTLKSLLMDTLSTKGSSCKDNLHDWPSVFNKESGRPKQAGGGTPKPQYFPSIMNSELSSQKPELVRESCCAWRRS